MHSLGEQELARVKDRIYLESLIDGSGNLYAEDTCAKLEPMFARYESDFVMYALLERAAEVYGDAALLAATMVLADIYIEESQRRADAWLKRSNSVRIAAWLVAWAAARIAVEDAQRPVSGDRGLNGQSER